MRRSNYAAPAIDRLRSALAGRYDIGEELGAGGMSTVYAALDVKHSRRVAVKVLDQELCSSASVERFIAEIRVTANLHHAAILPLFDSGEAEGVWYYIMPFMEGETLRARLRREGPLPIPEAVRIAVLIAGALDYAHRNGVVHRDLKPENILFHNGQPILADFGIAFAATECVDTRITQAGQSLGTPQYMSPEQAAGDGAVDGRTDIYSLGAIFYEMIAGCAPHAGNTPQAIIAKMMTEEPRPLSALSSSVPPHLDRAIRRALRKRADDRFTTAGCFAAALVAPKQRTIFSRGADAWTRFAASAALMVHL